jgi:hypothetical protein
MMGCWLHVLAAGSEHEEHGEGIELVPYETPHASPKIPAAYSVVEVPPSESGYDTDATAFSEGGFSDDDTGDDEAGALLSTHGEPPGGSFGAERSLLLGVP